jgi:hypothetical protein
MIRRAAKMTATSLSLKQAIDVLLLPSRGSRVVGKLAFLGEKLARMEAASSSTPTDLMSAVKHLVEHNPFDEEERHLGTVERGMHANDAVLDRKTAHLDGPLLCSEDRRPPSDARLQHPFEVPPVQAIENVL